MADPDETFDDLELELANELIARERDLEIDCNLPQSIVAKLSSQELEEFRRANECLNLLQLAGAIPLDLDSPGQSTLRDETLGDQISATEFGYPKTLGRFEANQTRYYQIKSQELLQAIYRKTGRPEQSRQCLMAAIESCQTIADENEATFELSSTHGILYHNLGLLDASLGQSATATQHYLQAVAILAPIARNQSAGESVARLRNAYLGVMTASEATGDYDLAIAFADKFVEEVSELDPRINVVRRSDADWLAQIGKFDQSLALIDELESRCSRSDDYYQLARTAAKCITALPDSDEKLNQETSLPLRSAYLTKTLALLRCAAPVKHETTIIRRVEEQPDFDSVRSEVSFRAMLANWVGEQSVANLPQPELMLRVSANADPTPIPATTLPRPRQDFNAARQVQEEDNHEREAAPQQSATQRQLVSAESLVSGVSKCSRKNSSRFRFPYAPPLLCPTPGRYTNSNSLFALINASASLNVEAGGTLLSTSPMININSPSSLPALSMFEDSP